MVDPPGKRPNVQGEHEMNTTIDPRRGTAGVQRRREAAVAAMTALALATAACTGGSDETSSAAPGGTAAAIEWTACGERLECATVLVPLDWADPGGQQITLAVIRHPASKPDQRIGTILINPGGPGDTGVGLVRDGGDDLDAWGGGRFDIVSWDRVARTAAPR
jgi:hypothetical protein